MNYEELRTLTTQELKDYLFSLSSTELEKLLDRGIRHKSSIKPIDYLEHWLMLTRPFACATQDDSWGELEKLLAIILKDYIKKLYDDISFPNFSNGD